MHAATKWLAGCLIPIAIGSLDLIVKLVFLGVVTSERSGTREEEGAGWGRGTLWNPRDYQSLCVRSYDYISTCGSTSECRFGHPNMSI
jgi:hypothetical protein